MARKPNQNYSALYPSILEDYQNNKSLRDIGKKHGLHPEIVRRILKKQGCQTRSMGEAMTAFHKNKGDKNGLGTETGSLLGL